MFVFRSRSGTAIRLLTYDGQGYWLAQKRLSKGRFLWWPEGGEFTSAASKTLWPPSRAVQGATATSTRAPTPDWGYSLPRGGMTQISVTSLRRGSVNIPADEVQIRARHELNQLSMIVMDCTVVPRPACVATETTLRERGFSKIAFLTNNPYGGLSCSTELPPEPNSQP